jgi:molecular chaperone DnaJ
VTICSQCGGNGQVRRIQQSLFGQIQTMIACPSCRGEGKIIANKCSSCNGEGRVGKVKNIPIDLPAGVSEGQIVRVKGQGNVGYRGGPNGDIMVVILEKKEDVLRRDGEHLFIEFPISFSQAALGDDIYVPVINKKIRLRVPAGTQSGKVFKVSKQGLPVVNSSRVGDLYVIVIVVTPQNVKGEEAKLYEKIKEYDNKRNLKADDKSFIDRLKEYF